MDVGVRGFRSDLRRWLNAVQAGEEIIVTDRGKPIARLVGPAWPSKLDHMVATGAAAPPRKDVRPAR